MLYPRKITEKIKEWLYEKEMIILNGSRQTGKTSLLKILKNELLKSGVPENATFYLNLEEISILESLNRDPENLLKYITDKSRVNFFFLDEVQYLDNPSNFLKHIYDKYDGKIKIIATGSSSLELKAKFQDSLVGRKISFAVNPLDFEEFLEFKKFPLLNYLRQKDLPEDIKRKFDGAMEEYLVYGGMPAVVLQDNRDMKKKMLEDYINTYINKDIRIIGKIDNIASFNSLVKILASQVGNLLNISELSNTANITRRNTEKFLDLLEFTFVVDKVFPFSRNVRAQVTKMPKFYFFDPGIRNAVIGNFSDMSVRTDAGFLFENFIYLEVKNTIGKEKVFFHRTLSGAEIDFVAENEDRLVLLEVKYKNIAKPIDSRVLENFMEKHKNVSKATVINLGFNYTDGRVEYADYRKVGEIFVK